MITFFDSFSLLCISFYTIKGAWLWYILQIVFFFSGLVYIFPVVSKCHLKWLNSIITLHIFTLIYLTGRDYWFIYIASWTFDFFLFGCRFHCDEMFCSENDYLPQGTGGCLERCSQKMLLRSPSNPHAFHSWVLIVSIFLILGNNCKLLL